MVVLALQPLHVTNRAALLALEIDDVLPGDIVIQDDNSHAYILVGNFPQNFSSWRQIDAEVSDADLSAETAARIAGDTGLQTNITSETSARTIADTNLQTNIDTEATARASADTTLQSNITAEATTRASADTTLQTNINTEASTRATADTTLQNNIDAETSARTSAVTAVQTNVTNEATARSAADTTLQTNINTETAARIAALNGVFQEAVNVVAGAGAAYTIPDVTVYQQHDITLNSAACTLTFPTAGRGKSFLARFRQDSSGSRVIILPGNIHAPGGVLPVLSTAANKCDDLLFNCVDGTNFDVYTVGIDVR